MNVWFCIEYIVDYNKHKHGLNVAFSLYPSNNLFSLSSSTINTDATSDYVSTSQKHLLQQTATFFYLEISKTF